MFTPVAESPELQAAREALNRQVMLTERLRIKAVIATVAILTAVVTVIQLVLPDIFIDQDSPAAMYEKAGLDSRGIVATAIHAMGLDRATLSRLRA